MNENCQEHIRSHDRSMVREALLRGGHIQPTDRRLAVPLDLIGAVARISKHVHPNEQDDVLDAMIDVAKRMTGGSTKIERAARAILADEMSTEVKRKSKAKDAVDKIALTILPRIDEATTLARSTLSRLGKEIMPTPLTDREHAQEIRSVIRMTEEDKRVGMIEKAIRDGDDILATAVLCAHPVTSGIGHAAHAALLDTWQRLRRPQLKQRMNRIKEALADLDRLTPLFLTYSMTMFSDDAAHIEAARKSSELAEEAIKEAAA